MTRQELLARLAAQRADAARLRRQADESALLDDVIALVEQLDGRDIHQGRDLTTREVAEELGLDNITIERYCRTNRFPGAYKTSGETGDWRIPPAALDVFRHRRAGSPKLARM